MTTLRPYQSDMVDAIRAEYRRRVRSVLTVAPTGSGKTVVFSYIAHHAQERGHRVLILVHRTELLDQVSAALTANATPHALIAQGHRFQPMVPVQVGSVFTVVKRLAKLAVPDLIIPDEAHHAVLSTTWGQVLAAFPSAKVLGVTATPVRLSGEGLGECFQSLVLGPTVEQLISIGALCPARVYAPPTISTEGLHSRMGDFIKAELTVRTDTPTVTGDAVKHYQRLTPGRAAVVFCVSVDHAKHVADQFNAAGISAHSVDGKMDRGLRRDIVGAFTAGRLLVLTSCDLISEGFDCPRIEVGISLRPTQSMGLWLQQVGRCLRPWPGKSEAVIFDHAGNTMRHGLPDDDREWTLEGRPRQARDVGAISVRICPSCFAANRSGGLACTECGAVFPVKPREIEQQDGDLVEVDKAERDRQRQVARSEVWQAKTEAELIALGERRGYKSPTTWASRIIAWRADKQAARKGYEQLTASLQT